MFGKCCLHALYGNMYLIIYRTILMSYKHKTHAVDSEGKVVSNADIDFSIVDVCVPELYSNILFVSIGIC